MDVLYVCNGFPFPLTSGYLRHYHLLAELAAEHRLTLLALVGPRFRPEDQRALADRTVRILTFPVDPPARRTARRVAARAALLASQGAPAARQMGVAIRALRDRGHYDAAIFSGKRTYPALAALDGLPLVVDLCDAASLRIRGQLRVAAPTRRPLLALDLIMTRRIERRLIARADHVLVASWRDRRALLGEAASPPASVVPNGVDAAAWRRRSPALAQDTIIFTGAMDYPPNVDAAVRLGHVILPRVQRAVPTARLLIVGRDPTPSVRALGARPGVTVTGWVAEMLPYLEAATVFAAPLRFGAGIQNKVLEAMSAGVPVVASPVAAAGLQLSDERQAPVTIAVDDEATAAALIDRLEAARRDPAPDRIGSAWVNEHFDWHRSGARLRAILDELVPGSARATKLPGPARLSGGEHDPLGRAAEGTDPW